MIPAAVVPTGPYSFDRDMFPVQGKSAGFLSQFSSAMQTVSDTSLWPSVFAASGAREDEFILDPAKPGWWSGGSIRRLFGLGQSTTELVKDELNNNKGSDPFDFDTNHAWLSHAKADIYAARFLRHYAKITDEQIEKLKAHSESWQVLRNWAKFTPLYVEHYERKIKTLESEKFKTGVKLLVEGSLVTLGMAAMGYGAAQAYQHYQIPLSEIAAILGPIIAFAGIYHSGAGRFTSYRTAIVKYEADIAALDRAKTNILSLFFTLKDTLLHKQQYGGDILDPEGYLTEEFKTLLISLTEEAKGTRQGEIDDRERRDEKVLNILANK